jgi:hypothetical protein
VALFDIGEIKKPDIKSKSLSKKTPVKRSSVLGKRYDKCRSVVGDLEDCTSIHYVSMGEWSSHDLLYHILKQTGPANVYMATWSIAEVAVRLMIEWAEKDMVKDFYGVLDWRVKVRRPKIYELLKYNYKLRLTTCHAKVFIIEGENISVSVVGSANFTNNPRIEAGVITCDKEIGDFHKNWLLSEWNNSKPFDE